MQWLERIRAQRARFSWRRSAPAVLGALLGSVMVLALLFTSLLPLLGGQAPAGAAPVGTATLRAPAATALASADKLAGQGDLYRAIARYGDVLAVDPRALAALARRAMLLRQLGSLPAALADFDSALLLAPDNVELLVERGSTHSLGGQYELAIADFNSALAAKPDTLLAYYGRGLARNGLKQYSAALLDFDTAVIMAPQFGAGFVDRGLTRMALQQPERALPDFSEAILIDPKNAAAYENRGAAFIALQRPADAIADYTQAALLDPNNPAVFNDRGSAYLRSGDAPRALADYQKALQLNGEFWQARTNLALLHIERGEYAAAEQQLRSALRIQPANLSAQRSMVVALRGLQKIARPPANQRRVSRETFFAGGVGAQHPLPFAGSAPALANKAGSCLRRRPALLATPQQLAVCHATAKHWTASSLPYLGLLWTSR